MQGSDPPPFDQGGARPGSPPTGTNTSAQDNTANHNNKGKKNPRNQQRHKGGSGGGHQYRDPATGDFTGALNAPRDPVHVPHNAVECVICADPCRALCVFTCGHFTCYSCGLRIHTIQGGACPICRTECAETIITQAVSTSAEKFSEEEMNNMRQLAITDRKLKCVIDGQPLARQVCKLYEFLCPADACWRRGEQDPFFEQRMLKDHLHVDHKLHYCDICLDSRPVFLCEQAVYDVEALQEHLEGKCTHDSSSFTGHPQCKFCKDAKTKLFSRFYDGEALLKHMQQNHFTCDLCNRGQFTYTFFENRNKLNQHFMQSHLVCDHPDCAHLDLMLRVFANEFELAAHKQRTHGIKAKVVLSLDGSMGTQTGYRGGSGGGGGGSGGGGPASANANALDITFDHIYRREVVNLMPSRSAGGASGKQRAKKGGHVTVANVPSEAGLPCQYYAQNAMPILVRGGGAGGGADGSDDEGASKRQSRASASRTAAAAKSAHGDKKSLQEQERELQAIIDRELRSPLALASFRRYTAEFLQSRLMTSEYYTALATECFPDPAVLAEVMPLLIATAPVEAKRTSLGEYWHVKQAPETQRMLRQTHEDEAKKREMEEQQRLWDELKRAQHRPKLQANKNNGRGNAWQTRGGGGGGGTAGAAPSNRGGTTLSSNDWTSHTTSGSRKGGQGATVNAWSSGPSSAVLSSGVTRDEHTMSSPPPQSSPSAASPNTASPRSAGGAWGAAVESANSPPPPPSRPSGVDLTSEELYPSLPTRPARLNTIGLIGKGGKQKKGKPNAWFSK